MAKGYYLEHLETYLSSDINMRDKHTQVNYFKEGRETLSFIQTVSIRLTCNQEVCTDLEKLCQICVFLLRNHFINQTTWSQIRAPNTHSFKL